MIAEFAFFISEVREAPMNASYWLDRVESELLSLKSMPHRFGFTQENHFRDYEIRAMPIGNYIALFTIDEESEKVWVIGFRHGHQQARSQGLPESKPID